MREKIFFITCCLLASLIPLMPMQKSAPFEEASFPGWPDSYDGKALQSVPLTEREKRFAEDFPGRIGRFTDGSRELIIRWVGRGTRSVHPAADCFKASGYTIRGQAMRIDENGHRWSAFLATREAESLRVYERIYSAAAVDENWTDVSSWYWSATLGRSFGPWWVVTIAE
jgi:hypothetical protein